MRQQIWKFTITDAQGIYGMWVPEGAKFLDVQEQDGQIVAWALITQPDTSEPKKIFRQVLVQWTGRTLPGTISPGCEWSYIGTAQLKGGFTVCHIFIETEVSP